jgi:signal transduction histidine kinase
MGLCVGTAVLYPAIIRGSAWFVDSVLLTREDYRALETQLTKSVHLRVDVADVMNHVCDRIQTVLSATAVRWHRVEDESSIDVSPLVTVDDGRSAEVLVPVTEPPRYRLEISDLTHGRRLLSGDVNMLTAIASIAARRIDSLRLASERIARETHDREVAQLVAEAELRALRAQLNPHFLFNALTTIGYLIRAAPDQAVETLLKLTTLLRAVLKPGAEFTTVGAELDLIETYLAIERARFEDRLRVHVDVPLECRSVSLPTLLLQPLVENAIKHGIGTSVAGGQVVIAARIDGDASQRSMRIAVTDSATIPILNRGARRPWLRGIGLSTVERRLACHYGASATLRIDADSAAATVVEVTIPVSAQTAGMADRSAG